MVLDGSQDMFWTMQDGEEFSFVATGIRLDLYAYQPGEKVKGVELRQE